MTVRLDTSDFSVESRPDGRVNAMIYAPEGDAIELDLDPGVARDLALALLDPEEPT